MTTSATAWIENKAIAEIHKDGGILIEEAGKKFPFHPVLAASGNQKTLPREGKMLSIHELTGMP